MNGYLTRLLGRTRALEQLVRPRPAAIFDQPIAGPEWRLNSPAGDEIKSQESEGSLAEPSSHQQRSEPLVPVSMKTERPLNTEANRQELPPREASENQVVATHVTAPPPPGGHTLRAVELGLREHIKGSAVVETDLLPGLIRQPPPAASKPDEPGRSQTLRPRDPASEPADIPDPEQATDQELSPRQAPELRGVQRLDLAPLAVVRPAEPVRALSEAVPPPAASPPALLGKRPARPIELSAERFASPQADTSPSPIGSASGVRPNIVGGDRPALPPPAKRTKQRAAGNLPEPATVHVTIGTLEVRANTMPGQPRAASAPKPQAPRLGLEEYLRRRRERGQG